MLDRVEDPDTLVGSGYGWIYIQFNLKGWILMRYEQPVPDRNIIEPGSVITGGSDPDQISLFRRIVSGCHLKPPYPEQYKLVGSGPELSRRSDRDTVFILQGRIRM